YQRAEAAGIERVNLATSLGLRYGPSEGLARSRAATRVRVVADAGNPSACGLRLRVYRPDDECEHRAYELAHIGDRRARVPARARNPRRLPLGFRQVNFKHPNGFDNILKRHVPKVGGGQFEAGAQLYPSPSSRSPIRRAPR